MRSFRSLDQPRQSVYTPQPHMSFYPQASREASDATQASDRHPCPPLITKPTPTNPKKRKDPARPIGNVDPPAAETHRPALRRRRHHLHLQPPPLRTSTTTDSSRRHSSTIPAAAVFTVLAPPQPSIPSAAVFTEPPLSSPSLFSV